VLTDRALSVASIQTMTDSQRGIPNAETWRDKGEENIEKWGRQGFGTLLLAAQEEMGELTQAYLEARDESGDPERMQTELDDLAALLVQMAWLLDDPGIDVTAEEPVDTAE
jgi:NTP pyrophosphatase (non-canonical NTP hydrolase)